MYINALYSGKLISYIEYMYVKIVARLRHWALSDQGQIHGVTLKFFLHLSQYKLSNHIYPMSHSIYVHLPSVKKIFQYCHA